MSKIYEALQHAYHEKKGDEKLPDVLVPMDIHTKALDHEIAEEMLSLYKTVETLLPYRKKKTLQFIGSREGEGTSTIVREFARISATRIGKSVLLLDGDRHKATQKDFFSIKSQYSWLDAFVNTECIDNALYQVGESRLFVSPSCNSSTSTPEMFDSPRFEGFWKNLTERFDLILIDSPPLTISPDGLAIAAKVDGVLLVLEAEKTRWQTAKNVKESITKIGGNVLGIVLNKRRYYIPQTIYNLL